MEDGDDIKPVGERTTVTPEERGTERRKGLFIKGYGKRGVIVDGLRAAMIGRSTYVVWMRDDEQFADEAAAALEDSIDEAEGELRTRGVEGDEVPVLYKGEPVWKRNVDGSLVLDDNFEPIPYTENRKSDKLLEVYVKANRAKYRDQGKISTELLGPDGKALPPPDIKVSFVLPDGKTMADYEKIRAEKDRETGQDF